MPLSMEELTSRYQNTCDKIKDSIPIIVSLMGSSQEFSFNINHEIYGLNTMDLHSTRTAMDQYITVMQEYKMLNYEKSRWHLEEQIQATQIKKMKEELKNKRYNTKSKYHPYKRDADVDKH